MAVRLAVRAAAGPFFAALGVGRGRARVVVSRDVAWSAAAPAPAALPDGLRLGVRIQWSRGRISALLGRYALAAVASDWNVGSMPGTRGAAVSALGAGRGPLLFLALSGGGDVRSSGSVGRALPQAAWGSAGPPAAAAATPASARADAGRQRGFFFLLRIFLPFYHGAMVEAALAGEPYLVLLARSGAPGAGGSARGGARV